MTKLREIKQIVKSLFEQNGKEVWSKINAVLSEEHNVSQDLSSQIKGQAKVWINTFFDILETKIQAHQEIKAQLTMHEAMIAAEKAELVQKTLSLKLN